jgi:hypothetical protein
MLRILRGRRSAAIVLCLLAGISGRQAPGADYPCIEPLDQDTIDRLVLRATSSVQPGEQANFTLGTMECCVFMVPVAACAEWSVEPEGAAAITFVEDGTIHHGPGSTGHLDLSPAVPAGTTIFLRADVEGGRKALETTIHVYTPESNPLTGYWQEKAEVTCGSFRRADVDGSGEFDLSDAIGTFAALFLGGKPIDCQEAADANDDGAVDISDGIFILSFLFLGGPPPSSPFPDCGEVPSQGLACIPPGTCADLVVEPRYPIGELHFLADGSFSVTWIPFEIYLDYWGSYTFDPATGEISLTIENGNWIPPDFRLFDGPRFRVEGGVLSLDGLWLGTPFGGDPGIRCGHRFEQYGF